MAAMLSLLAIVVSGCSGTTRPAARTSVQELQSEESTGYAQATRAFAQEVKPLARKTPEGTMNAVTEPAGCDINEEGRYGDALYDPEEPLASMIELVKKTEEDCNNEQKECFRDCWDTAPVAPDDHIKKGTSDHYRYCQTKCLKGFMDCMKKAGLVKRFTALDDALAWVKNHGKEILGTLIVVGTITYVVATGGGGVLILTVL